MPTLTESAAALRAQDPLAKLSPRERQIFALIGAGYQSLEIADSTGISPRTVEQHKRRIREKLELDRAADVEKFAISVATQSLRTALQAAARDFETVADLAGHTTPAGAHALSSIKRIASAAECAA